MRLIGLLPSLRRPCWREFADRCGNERRLLSPIPAPAGLTTFAIMPRLGAIAKPESYRSRSEEHTSELQSRLHLVCRLLLEKKNEKQKDSSRPLHSKSLMPSSKTLP